MKALKLLVVAMAASPLIAFADSLTLSLDTVVSGGTPAGTSPWISAYFTDYSGGVHLKLDASNLVSGEFVTDWTFNLTDWTKVISPSGATSSPAGIYPVISTSNNGEKAGPLKDFDITFFFTPDNNSNPPFRLNGGNSYEVDLAGLSVADFNLTNKDGSGIYFSAAHIQGIPVNNGGKDSAWIATSDGGGGGSIPEPSTYAAFAGLAALALGVWRHRRTI